MEGMGEYSVISVACGVFPEAAPDPVRVVHMRNELCKTVPMSRR